MRRRRASTIPALTPSSPSVPYLCYHPPDRNLDPS